VNLIIYCPDRAVVSLRELVNEWHTEYQRDVILYLIAELSKKKIKYVVRII